LVEAADERQLSKLITRYGRVDLICLDLCRPRDYADFVCGGEGNGPGEVGFLPARFAERSA